MMPITNPMNRTKCKNTLHTKLWQPLGVHGYNCRIPPSYEAVHRGEFLSKFTHLIYNLQVYLENGSKLHRYKKHILIIISSHCIHWPTCHTWYNTHLRVKYMKGITKYNHYSHKHTWLWQATQYQQKNKRGAYLKYM